MFFNRPVLIDEDVASNEDVLLVPGMEYEEGQFFDDDDDEEWDVGEAREESQEDMDNM